MPWECSRRTYVRTGVEFADTCAGTRVKLHTTLFRDSHMSRGNFSLDDEFYYKRTSSDYTR